MSQSKKATNALHAGHDPKLTGGTRAVPIYQTTSYVFQDTAHAARLFGLEEFGNIYTRLNNPTNDILEQRMAAVEGGIGAVAYASGTAAISSTFLTLLRTGEHIVAANSLYGGTYNLLNVTLPRFGIQTSFVDPDNVDEFDDAIQENTRAIFIESLGNPKLDVLDIEAIASILAMENSVVPPTINHTTVDENINSSLNLTLNKAQEREIKVAMSNTFGFGGHNACVLFKKLDA